MSLTDEQKLRALQERPPVIVLDLDDTIIESQWPGMGDFLPGAVDAIRAFLEAGWTVQVFSCRLHQMEPDFSGPRDKAEWLIEFCKVKKKFVDAGIGEVEILAMDKPPAAYYVDDKGLEFDPKHPAKSWRRIKRKVLS